MTARRLTARFVETVTVDVIAGRAAFPDAAVEGLELRVSASGRKSWALRYARKSDNARRRVTLGRFPDVSLEKARHNAAKLRIEIAEGEDPAGGIAARKVAVTFAELTEEWIERHAIPNKSARAVEDNRSMLKRDILPLIGAMKAAEVTKRDVIKLLDTVATRSDLRASVRPSDRRLTTRPNRVYELVRAICRWAVGRDILQYDPTWGMKAPVKRNKPRDRALSPAEIAIFWAALDRTPLVRRHVPAGYPRSAKLLTETDVPMTRATALAMKLALITGQRIGEVAGIAESELATDGGLPIWVIPRGRTKNSEPNRVPLSPIALRTITEARELAAGSPWLFPGPAGEAMQTHSATRALERSRNAIGIAHFRVHDLRRTAATGMAEKGISPHTIGLVLNHITVRRGTVTSGVYIHYAYDKEKREALEVWGRRLEEIVGIRAGVSQASVPSSPDATVNEAERRHG